MMFFPEEKQDEVDMSATKAGELTNKKIDLSLVF